MGKDQKGITLIALVITIIVLLILAGVSIAMISGQDGILNKSVKAADETTLETAREQATMAVSAAMADYYEDRYAEKTSAATSNEFQEWVKSYDKWPKGSDKYWTFNKDASDKQITLTAKGLDKDGKATVEVTGTIGEKGGITWSDGKTTTEETTSSSGVGG